MSVRQSIETLKEMLSNPATAKAARDRFDIWAHEAQLPPVGDWSTWLFMGGRGAGKTRAGSEWVCAAARGGRVRRIALVGPTLGDVREVMIEGQSGICCVANPDERPVYSVTRRRLVWPNGCEAHVFSSEDPDSLRGPQFDLAWCDEIGAWTHGEATWNMLMFGLRLGEQPRVLATTTPRSTDLVRRLVNEARDESGRVVMTRAGTERNRDNLSPGFCEHLRASYAGTHLERQELEGELVEDLPGALFRREVIERFRLGWASCAEVSNRYERVVVAVDPPASVGPDADACGIVVAGMIDECVHVLADCSAQGLSPVEWAKRAMGAAEDWGAGRIVAEANQGGEMVRSVLKAAGGSHLVRIDLRHATKSKRDRAEPVSVLYEQGRVRHAGVFRELEDEMCSFGGATGGSTRRFSPDRVDALVWAVGALVAEGSAKPGIGLI